MKGHQRFSNWTERQLEHERLTADDLYIKANNHFYHGVTRNIVKYVLRTDQRFESKGEKTIRHNGNKYQVPIWGLRHEHCLCNDCGTKLEQEVRS